MRSRRQLRHPQHQGQVGVQEVLRAVHMLLQLRLQEQEVCTQRRLLVSRSHRMLEKQQQQHQQQKQKQQQKQQRARCFLLQQQKAAKK
jgi:hypothetical protein